MGILFGIVMSICLLPTLLIMFFMMYPKNWKKSKLLFGVTIRKEFLEGETGNVVSDICTKHRVRARWILIASFVIAMLLFIVQNFILKTIAWMIFLIAAIIGIILPFVIGNKEMKNIKKQLGIGQDESITLTDINNAGSVRTFRLSRVLIPNVIGFIILITALLIDLKVIPVSTGIEGTFVCTGASAVFLLTGFIITIAAYMMDGLKNEVISRDSGINANYNRAKKKNMSDFAIKFLWIHIVMPGGLLLFNALWYSELGLMICILVYVFIIMTGMVMFVKRERKIERRYADERTISEDEDDYWIGGLIYYNPNNRRLNVKKRVGVGGTINLAHPAGKLISIIIALILVASIGAMVYIGMAEATPIKLKIEDDKLVCHHLSDDYVIEFDSINNIALVQDIDTLKFIKISGIGMDNLLKGNFSVNGEGGCKIFLNPQNGNCIKIEANSTTYYIGGETAEETSEIFFAICPQLKQLRKS